MDLLEAIAVMVEHVPDPSQGLPDELFYYISRMTPLVNVDLLTKDEKGRTLLAWRDDQYAGKGWHIPGGIVRHRETLAARVNKVAESELGTAVSFDPTPIALNELINPTRPTRGHFISILYRCFLPSSFTPRNEGLSVHDPGYLEWHTHSPTNLIRAHEIYRRYIDNLDHIA